MVFAHKGLKLINPKCNVNFGSEAHEFAHYFGAKR